jgi:paraquat-inducible protein B
MTDAHANISQKKRLSPIWIVPIVALALGIYMVIVTLQSQGPEIEIVFSTAEGLEAGKTKIKFRDVEIGLVESVGLGNDLETVVVTASLEKAAGALLREDTEFWVVRARIGRGGVSGLSTMLSGGYIQIAPGSVTKKRFQFVGLEEPPVTPAGTPGKRLTILADHAGSIGVGDPILYKGFTVGAVEDDEFNVESQGMRYEVFINAPYDDLLSSTTRFWNVSGISVSADASGISASIGSLESLLMGGVEFGLADGVNRGNPIESGAIFQLYDNYAQVNERPYVYGMEYVLQFTRSVRGLEPGAPVEYRGLPVGQVIRVMLDEFTQAVGGGTANPIPVLIRLEPARMQFPDSPEGMEQLSKAVETSAMNGGMRASLATGNLLTGSLYVNFDIYPNEGPAEIGVYRDRPTIPTIESGLGGIEHRITTLLDKINALPLDDTVAEFQAILANLNEITAGEGMQSLPASMDATLRELQKTVASFSSDSELQSRLLPTITELDQTLSSLRQVLDTLKEQPNALIFNRAPVDDPRPPAGSQ